MRLRTGRLDLLPCSVEVARARFSDRPEIETLLGMRVPDDWPAPDLRDFSPLYAQQFEADPALLG
jgi:ribosomal-protein-alanine N-acetyltransferase